MKYLNGSVEYLEISLKVEKKCLGARHEKEEI